MTNPPDDREKWEHTNKALQKSESSDNLPLNPSSIGMPAGLGLTPSGIRAPDGIVAAFKAGQMEKKAALKVLKTYYDAQLDVITHTLAEATKVRRAEASKVAERHLQILTEDHLRFLGELGLRNEEFRNRALFQLIEQTTAALRQFESFDGPDQLKQEAIEQVIGRHRKFAAKLSEDLGESV